MRKYVVIFDKFILNSCHKDEFKQLKTRSGNIYFFTLDKCGDEYELNKLSEKVTIPRMSENSLLLFTTSKLPSTFDGKTILKNEDVKIKE